MFKACLLKKKQRKCSKWQVVVDYNMVDISRLIKNNENRTTNQIALTVKNYQVN